MATKKYPEAIAHYPKAMQIFIKTICNRVWAGKNALIVVVGQTGSGKSWATVALMIGIHLYQFGKMPDVDDIINKRCIFRAESLMRNLNNEHLAIGGQWNWDEAGIDIGHKSHMTMQNRVIGWLAQTFRNQRQIIFFTVPTVTFIDASVRKLLHFYLETQEVIKRDKVCIVKPLHYQYNIRQDKMYYHNFTYPNKDGFIDEVDVMPVPLAPKEYIDAYEKKKTKFTVDLNEEILFKLESNSGDKKPLTENQKKILECLERGVTLTTELSEIIGITQPAISQNLGFMKRKGYNIDKFLRKKGFISAISSMPKIAT